MNTSTPKASKNLNRLKPLQITQINTKSMGLSGIVRTADHLEPMVSAEIQDNVNGRVINIKIVVLIPQTLLGQEPITLYQDLDNPPKNELKLIVKSNSNELVAPEYYPWYVNYLHPLSESDKIEIITTRIEDLIPDDANPRTSRGTMTQVLQS